MKISRYQKAQAKAAVNWHCQRYGIHIQGWDHEYVSCPIDRRVGLYGIYPHYILRKYMAKYIMAKMRAFNPIDEADTDASFD